MRSALIVATLSLSILAAPVPEAKPIYKSNGVGQNDRLDLNGRVHRRDFQVEARSTGISTSKDARSLDGEDEDVEDIYTESGSSSQRSAEAEPFGRGSHPRSADPEPFSRAKQQRDIEVRSADPEPFGRGSHPRTADPEPVYVRPSSKRDASPEPGTVRGPRSAGLSKVSDKRDASPEPINRIYGESGTPRSSKHTI